MSIKRGLMTSLPFAWLFSVGGAAGVTPHIMGISPATATKKLRARLGTTIRRFDLIKLDEAFASQGIAVLRQLGIAVEAEHVIPNGGAIALGHPLRMSRVRRAAVATHSPQCGSA